MTTQPNVHKRLETVRKQLEPICPISDLWVYRKGAIYYLRMRPKGIAKEAVTVSLRTSNRRYAMTQTREIRAKMQAFHLDNPEALFPELAVKLREIAVDTLALGVGLDELDDMSNHYTDWLHDLGLIVRTQGLTPDQAKAALIAARIARAGTKKLKGEPEHLLEIIAELTPVEPSAARVEPVVAHVEPGEPVTFSMLAGRYISERTGDVQESTLKSISGSCLTISKELADASGAELDLKTHTRDDMVDLKSKLMEGRKASTVNKLLTQLSTVLTWAVNNGYLERSYDKGLKITKGSESTRKPFSRDQMQKIMDVANSLPIDSWERWAITIGCITGARIGEIYQLTKADVVKLGDEVVIDINMDEDKTLKNKHSRRTVPLIDGAYGFKLSDFMAFVDGCEVRLFTAKPHYFNKPLNEALRDILGTEAGGDYTFHSLRHSMSTLMRSMGIHSGIAGDILGHSTGTITFDLYGKENKVNVDKMASALREAFSVTK